MGLESTPPDETKNASAEEIRYKEAALPGQDGIKGRLLLDPGSRSDGIVIIHESEPRPILEDIDTDKRKSPPVFSIGPFLSSIEVEVPEPGTDISREPDGLFRQEGEALMKDTLKAIAQFFIEKFAMVHGLYPVYKVVELVLVGSHWVRVGEGDGGIDVAAPIPIVPGVNFDLTLHLGDGANVSGPRVTACFTPSGLPPVGVLAVDGFEIDPRVDNADRRAGDVSAADVSRIPERRGRVGLFPLDLSGAGLSDDPREKVAAVWNWQKRSCYRGYGVGPSCEMLTSGSLLPTMQLSGWLSG